MSSLSRNGVGDLEGLSIIIEIVRAKITTSSMTRPMMISKSKLGER